MDQICWRPVVRVKAGGAAIAVEIWSVPALGLAPLLLSEPPGLTIGKVNLPDRTDVLGVLAEPVLCEGQEEITRYAGWRCYRRAKAALG